MAQPDLSDYVPVADRIAEFRAKHPEGSLRPWDLDRPWQPVQVGDQWFVVVVAAAYRSPMDPAPGVGMAWEPVPGTTPYTRNSELQNAETAAWGRAIVAALAGDTKKGIASKEDVQNRTSEDSVPGVNTSGDRCSECNAPSGFKHATKCSLRV